MPSSRTSTATKPTPIFFSSEMVMLNPVAWLIEVQVAVFIIYPSRLDSRSVIWVRWRPVPSVGRIAVSVFPFVEFAS